MQHGAVVLDSSDRLLNAVVDHDPIRETNVELPFLPHHFEDRPWSRESRHVLRCAKNFFFHTTPVHDAFTVTRNALYWGPRLFFG